MVNNVGDLKAEFLVRHGVSTTSGYYSDTILGDWIQQAHRFAAGYKKWPMTEGRVSTTYVSNQEEWDLPEGWKADSIRLLQVGGKRFEKVDFRKYQAFREDESSSEEKVFSDFGRLYFVNPGAGVSGTMTVWGQFTPAEIDVSVPASTTVFSDADDEGNLAIVELMQSYAFMRERELDKSEFHHRKALEILEGMAKRFADEQFNYLSPRGDQGMWKRVDVLGGDYYSDQMKRDQFY